MVSALVVYVIGTILIAAVTYTYPGEIVDVTLSDEPSILTSSHSQVSGMPAEGIAQAEAVQPPSTSTTSAQLVRRTPPTPEEGQ